MNIDTLFFVTIVLDLVLLLAVLWMYFRYKKLFRGKQGSDLERLMMSYVQDISVAGDAIKEIRQHLETLQKQTDGALQKVAMKRFNPFEAMGGDQSFSVAILNESNSGFVLTSLFGREGTRVYAKAIKDGASEHPLMDEEVAVLKEALRK